MINKSNSIECHASYREGLLKFFTAFRMTTEHQFFAGDASLPRKKEMGLHQKALPQNLLYMYLSNYADKV
ncbi:MAG: hypothetical protein V7K76_22155 [Nostoc sp.]